MMRFFRRKKTIQGKTKVVVPGYYEQITLGQYTRYKLAKNDFDRVKAITEKPDNIVEQLTYEQVRDIIEIFEKLLAMPTQLKRDRVVLGGVQYGFHPNMDAMTLGEHIDATSNVNDMDKWVKTIAVLYRPITMTANNRYRIEDYDPKKHQSVENLKRLEQMPMHLVNGLHTFFLTIQNELLISSELSSIMTMREAMEKATNLAD